MRSFQHVPHNPQSNMKGFSALNRAYRNGKAGNQVHLEVRIPRHRQDGSFDKLLMILSDLLVGKLNENLGTEMV